MQVSIARTIAFDALLRVESESAYASDVLHSALRLKINPSDAALATELTFGVLRWRRLIDLFVDRQIKKPVASLDLPVAIALRLGFYQLRFLDKIPARAAVNESVELVKRARKSSAASLVNAVLRRAAAEAKLPAERLLQPNLPPAERLGVLYSHPTWMVERWLARFGESGTISLLEANNRAPRLALAVRDPQRHDELLRKLESSGLHADRGRLLKTSIIVSGASVARTEPFRAGHISIQDEASQAIPLLLDVQPGDHVLDLCAAPGGKTVALAHGAGPCGLVIAAELHEHRLRSMREQLTRLRIEFADRAGEGFAGSGGAPAPTNGYGPRVHLVALDARRSLPFAVRFDRILVDAPCSGTGTLARHPEIRWRIRPERFAELQALQRKLLRNALALLAPGGRLVYSTCSIEPEENETVVSEILKTTGEGEEVLQKGAVGALVPASSIRVVAAGECAATLAPHLAPGITPDALFDARGFFRTSPPAHATDGFFAAVLQKTQ